MYKKWKERLIRDATGNTSSQRSEQSDALQDDTEARRVQACPLVVPESTKIAKRCLADFEAQISTFRLKKRE